jgi:hypothetical protein
MNLSGQTFSFLNVKAFSTKGCVELVKFSRIV